jgi:tetratricopeptide (TPR) repeat protein
MMQSQQLWWERAKISAWPWMRQTSDTAIKIVLGIIFVSTAAAAFAQDPPSDTYQRGLQAYTAGDFAQSASIMKAAEDEHPGKSDALLIRARALLKLGSLAESESSVRAYLEVHATSADGLYLLGYVLSREARPADSLAAYTHAAQYQPPKAGDLKVVALDYVLLEDYADADKWLTQSVAWAPEDADAWYYLGRTKYNENRFAEAIDAFTTCLKLDPKSVRAEDNLGLSYEALNRHDEAISAYQTAIDWQADAAHKDAQPYLNLGNLLTEKRKLQEALPYLQKAAALAPQNPKAHEKLGYLYVQLNKLEPAQREFERAVALAPAVSALHFQLGRIYRRTGQAELAKKEFDECAKLNGSHSATETPNPVTPD